MTTPSDPLALLRSRSYVALLVLAAIIGVPISAAAYFFLALVNKGKQRSAADAAGRPAYATGAWTSWPRTGLARPGQPRASRDRRASASVSTSGRLQKAKRTWLRASSLWS